jgi:hypothetical protein
MMMVLGFRGLFRPAHMVKCLLTRMNISKWRPPVAGVLSVRFDTIIPKAMIMLLSHTILWLQLINIMNDGSG